MLLGDQLFVLPDAGKPEAFDATRLISRDWTGTDLRRESQGPHKDPVSIQRAVIETMLSSAEYDIVFDDDGSGEAADVIGLRLSGSTLHVHLNHCKYSSDDTPGARVQDLYDVCGQAQKSICWRADPRKFLKHLRRREGDRQRAGRPSRFEAGDPATISGWLGRWDELSFEFRITAVQPGYSKRLARPAHMDLLAATSALLMDTWAIPFEFVCSH